MAARLLVILLPVAKALALKLIERLRDEAKAGTLHDPLSAFAPEVMVVCDAILSLASATADPGK